MAENPLPDYYGLLEVHPRASDLVIKKAFRALMAGGAHPDAGGSPERARLLTEAYAVLSDPEKRRRYDLSLLMTSRAPAVEPRAEGPAGPGTNEPAVGSSPDSRAGRAAPGSPAPPARPGGTAASAAPVASGRLEASCWRGAVAALVVFLLGLGVGLGLPSAIGYLGLRFSATPADGSEAEARYHLGAGEAFRQAGKPDEAEVHLRRAIALAPADAVPLARLGDLLAETGRTDAAADAYRKAIALASGDPALYTHLGLAYLMMRDTTGAEAALSRALALDKDFRPALVALGQVYQERGRYADALELYGRAEASGTSDADLKFRLAEVALAMGDRERAIAEWRECLALPGASRLQKERARRGLSNLGAWYDEGAVASGDRR